MRISFSPQRRDDALTVHKRGDVLTINGEVFDFSELPNGGTLPADAINSQWIVGDVVRGNGGVSLTLLLPHGANPSEAVAFPAILVNPANGNVPVPFDRPPVQPEPIAQPEGNAGDE
ncbi:hypothetical protein VW29_02685 [Devosia limi DSM 17137]|uniref:Uncharacterized protein n=1 Tax=Devosia limi DSM 17137 TaxID=1121477 RepID=A0A0F5LXU3_9HYPH|nr:hypothetical protein [Devosia limi]KKB86477.1 hypothetical protein VW29_02685 [Devosia limi DSM 17137]SHE87386.1 hypothetical protein SAMN02745223_01287 [Devosia limi DSM 17137]